MRRSIERERERSKVEREERASECLMKGFLLFATPKRDFTTFLQLDFIASLQTPWLIS